MIGMFLGNPEPQPSHGDLALPVTRTRASVESRRKTSRTVKNYKAHLERPTVSGELANSKSQRIKDKGRIKEPNKPS